MADLDDVANTLVGMIGGILYPNGAVNPPVVQNAAARIFQGWPIPAKLDADLAEGFSQVSVYPRQEERNTTRYNLQWQPATVNTPTLTLTVAGQNVTVAGSVPPATANNPHNVMVMVNAKPYVYGVQPTDTTSSIATALATLLLPNFPGTTSNGPVLQLPPAARIGAARVGVQGTGVQEIRRQERLFQIGIWSSSPANRTAIAQAIDPIFAATQFIVMPDLSAGRLIYKSSHLSDELEKQNLYRRDLFYTVEYPTLQTETETEITEEQLNISVEYAGTPPAEPLTTVFI